MQKPFGCAIPQLSKSEYLLLLPTKNNKRWASNDKTVKRKSNSEYIKLAINKIDDVEQVISSSDE